MKLYSFFAFCGLFVIASLRLGGLPFAISLFGVACWFTFYVIDMPRLGTPQNLSMPTLSSLEEHVDRNTEQKYIDEVIIPAHGYFIMRKSAEKYDAYSGTLLTPFSILLPLHLIGKNVCSLSIDLVWKILLCSAMPLAIFFILAVLYRKSAYCMRHERFDDTLRFHFCTTAKENKDLIFEHYKYLQRVFIPMRNRYYASLTVNYLSLIAFLVMLPGR